MKKFFRKRITAILIFAFLAVVCSIVEVAFNAKASIMKEQLVLMQAGENSNLVEFETALKIYDSVSGVLCFFAIAFAVGIVAEFIFAIIYTYSRRQI